MTASAIPVLIVGGYLGSGKTTLINEALRSGLTNAAIIVNDFGDVNIDAQLIRQFSSDTLELTNGCVCCSIGESLADTLFMILDRPIRPEVIVIETSGVSDPAAVAAFTHMNELSLAGILVLVDASQLESTYSQNMLRKTIERQLSSAHVITMTKTDIATEEDLTAATEIVRAHVSSTPIVNAHADALVSLITSPAHEQPQAEMTGHSPFTHSHHDFAGSVTRDDIVSYIHNLPPTVVRAKGVIALSDGTNALIQKTGTHVSITSTSLTPTGLVIISAD